MKTIRTDVRYLNKLFRGLLADSAIGFVALAVGVTLMTIFLHYDILLRPNPFATAGQSSRQLDQVEILIASAELFGSPPPATGTPELTPVPSIAAPPPAPAPAPAPVPAPAAVPVPLPVTQPAPEEAQVVEDNPDGERGGSSHEANRDYRDDRNRRDDRDDRNRRSDKDKSCSSRHRG